MLQTSAMLHEFERKTSVMFHGFERRTKVSCYKQVSCYMSLKEKQKCHVTNKSVMLHGFEKKQVSCYKQKCHVTNKCHVT